jgi:predicted dehydrogenase
MKALRILVVGAGSIGAQRAAAACAARGTALAGVVDIDLGRARTVAGRLGVFAAGSLEEGLGWEGVDAVVVATPHANHVESVELALARGEHVLCEKPLAIDPADARRLAAQADDAGLRLATGFNHRFYAPIRDLLSLVENDTVGRVEGVRVQIGHHASDAFLRGWHTNRTISGGGTLIDNGVHACDLIRLLVGEVESVTGRVRRDSSADDNCEREAFGLFVGSEGALAELHSSWVLRRGYLTIEVRGDHGWLVAETAPWRLLGEIAGGRRVDRRYRTGRLAERIFRARSGCERSLVVELEAFAAGIGLGWPGLGASAEDGCRATEMVRGLYESDRRRAEVALVPRVGDEPARVAKTRERMGRRA